MIKVFVAEKLGYPLSKLMAPGKNWLASRPISLLLPMVILSLGIHAALLALPLPSKEKQKVLDDQKNPIRISQVPTEKPNSEDTDGPKLVIPPMSKPVDENAKEAPSSASESASDTSSDSTSASSTLASDASDATSTANSDDSFDHPSGQSSSGSASSATAPSSPKVAATKVAPTKDSTSATDSTPESVESVGASMDIADAASNRVDNVPGSALGGESVADRQPNPETPIVSASQPTPHGQPENGPDLPDQGSSNSSEKGQPDQSSLPAPSSTRAPVVVAKAADGQTKLVADFPHYQTAEADCYELGFGDNCRIVKNAAIAQVTEFFRKELPTQQINVALVVNEPSHKVLKVSRGTQKPLFLNIWQEKQAVSYLLAGVIYKRSPQEIRALMEQ